MLPCFNPHTRSLPACQRGAALITFALMLPLLIIVLAVVTDLSRLYAAQNKAQNASDAALLGAVATARTDPNVLAEFTRLFAANYPAGYMGSTVGGYQVTPSPAASDDDVFNSQLVVHVPSIIVGVLGNDATNLIVQSQATRVLPNARLELTLVLDNTGSMGNPAVGGGTKIQALRAAAAELTNILFGTSDTLNNLTLSIVPYDVAVNIGAGHDSWVQTAYQARYNSLAGANGNGFVSNRNRDALPNGLNDISDALPTVDSARFRTPFQSPLADCADRENTGLPKMRFGMHNKTEVLAAINTMVAGGCTRINVGLMWGWFTLSPTWTGFWSAGEPNLPAAPNPLLTKSMVLMTDGQNTVFHGSGGVSDDDTTTAALCTVIKQQGITLYTVGFGQAGDVNPTLLQNCATPGPGHYWLAPSAAELSAAFQAIADDIVNRTLRLSK